MPKDTNKKANPALEDDELEEKEAPKAKAKAAAKAPEAKEETENDEEELDENVSEDDEEDTEDEEEDEDEKPKAKAKGAKKPLIEREAPKARPRNSIDQAMRADAKIVREALEKQPKVRLFIPLGINEKAGSPSAFESVTINGYRMVLPKGEYVTVPQAVADIIEAHYNMTPENTEMGQAYRLDRARTKDGMSTDEALG